MSFKANKPHWRLVLGAAFLMATSAVGPGFLTQTTVFTQQLGASFAFVILISILLDVGAQLNIWRVIVISKLHAQDIANKLLPGLGHFLAAMVSLGGLAFNIGNIGGAGLGVNVLFPQISPVTGALLSALIAIGLFLLKDAAKMMDKFAIFMGAVLIVMTVYVLLQSNPPLVEASYRAVWPKEVSLLAIMTLVGGTVGGYITFAGAHRLIDANVVGEKALPQVNRGSISAISIASIVRVMLFLAALGVISQGVQLDASNPPASLFQHAAGLVGYKIFGVVLWAAAITSVIGSAYTSASFLKTLHVSLTRHNHLVIIGFISISTVIFCSIGKPIFLMIAAGAVNGFILPLALGVMLVAAKKTAIVGQYQHPKWMSYFGWFITITMLGISVFTLFQLV